MRKIIIALFTAFVLVLTMAVPANAASVGTSRNYLVDDDELNAYITASWRINYIANENFKTVTSLTATVRPNKNYNSTISCRSTVIDKFKFNPGGIGNTNPDPKTVNCDPDGVAVNFDIPNQVIWNSGTVDRCVGVKITVVKAYMGDRVINFPEVCLPR